MFNPYEDMLDEIEREMRRISDDMLLQMFRLHGTTGEVWSPRVDVFETRDKLIVKVCAAGIKPEQVDISLSPDSRHLIVRGIRSESNMIRRGVVRYYQLEVYYGPFERVIALPDEVQVDRESLHATYKEGFLVITLPKTNARKSRKVPITE